MDFSVKGSFRDPAGHVQAYGNRIFRTVTQHGATKFEAVLASGFLDELVEAGRLVPFEKVEDQEIIALFPNAVHVLEHPRLDYVSHPYEWSFPLLKAAALLHLDVMVDALAAGISLSDATAYNVQFVGSRPVFIDHLSFKPYVEGEYWMAHRQFCEQFLNPLLLRSRLGMPHNAWFRGAHEGISCEDMSKLLPMRDKISPRVMAHVVFPARLQKQALKRGTGKVAGISERRGLPRTAYKGLLQQLRNWIASLEPKGTGRTVWGDYAEDNTYTEAEDLDKSKFIARFIADTKPNLVFDLGCNSGAFSEVALKAGAKQVIGFDFDQTALDKAYLRARGKNINYLPLFLDAANPSPSQGWAEGERPGFSDRAHADAVLALAFEHHLAIGKNIPLDQVVDWITSMAPHGIIEFVRKDDPTIRAMLAMREDIFVNYSRKTFEAALEACTTIEEHAEISSGGRVLYRYKRALQV